MNVTSFSRGAAPISSAPQSNLSLNQHRPAYFAGAMVVLSGQARGELEGLADKLKTKKKRAEDELQKAREEKASLEKDLAAKKQELKGLPDLIKQLDGQIAALKAKQENTGKLEADRRTCREKTANLKQAIPAAERRLGKLKQEIEKLKKSIGDLKTAKDKATEWSKADRIDQDAVRDWMRRTRIRFQIGGW